MLPCHAQPWRLLQAKDNIVGSTMDVRGLPEIPVHLDMPPGHISYRVRCAYPDAKVPFATRDERFFLDHSYCVIPF
jgi:hypothetical protein